MFQQLLEAHLSPPLRICKNVQLNIKQHINCPVQKHGQSPFIKNVGWGNSFKFSPVWSRLIFKVRGTTAADCRYAKQGAAASSLVGLAFHTFGCYCGAGAFKSIKMQLADK